MYAIVNATGGGAVITVDARGNMTACAWTVIPQLVDVVILNFTAYAAATTENATIMPAPAGRATYLTVQGMAQAINLGARLDTNYGNTQPAAISDTAQMLQVLIADGIKGAVTAYTDIVCSTGCSFPSGQVCDSNNRTIQQHWRFGNEHNLGWLAIILTIGFGLAAVYMVWYLRKRPYIRGIDPLKIVDAFDMGMHYDRSAGYGGGKAIQIRNGKVVSKVMWNNGDDVEGIPLRIGRETAYTRMYNE
ncbi:hypothetical protein BT96DRAFT_429675 [Gymnopus androsaceus JB14]|uniref:Uncharacterized protein n=1 Tax=Gymnopus androsaceus JB14 TaxID=1447944 RepID=A0A6A4GSG7_9AGAR|nr:hypothetical protein BT96DRAFT_429675 [Gymnopus androsaceus JB14]